MFSGLALNKKTTEGQETLLSLTKAPNGFNTIRLIAAILVLFSHAFTLTDNPEPLHIWTGQITLGGLSVAVFFAISGYLIPMSYDRSSLGQYVVKRTQRLMPALVVAVLLCAFALGPVITDLSTLEYFTNFETLKFLGNALFLPVGYDLPGVFKVNPVTAVNGSLWSLKFEVACYGFVVIACGYKAWRKQIIVSAWIMSFGVVSIIPEPSGGAQFYVKQMADLFRFFGTGMILYMFSHKVTITKTYGYAAMAITIAAAKSPFFVICASTLGVYALFVFSYNCPGWFKDLTKKRDISYGVYVYAFPVQQLLVPLSLSLAARSLITAPYLNTMLSLLPVLILGVVSWEIVEKPFLSRAKLRRSDMTKTGLSKSARETS